MPKKFVPLTPEEILAMQQPSTRALLTENEAEAKEYFQGLHGKSQVTQEDIDSGRVAKPLRPEDLSPEAWKNSRLKGQRREDYYLQDPEYVPAVSISPEKRDSAVEAYMAEEGTTVPSIEEFKQSAVQRAIDAIRVLFRIKTKDEDKV